MKLKVVESVLMHNIVNKKMYIVLHIILYIIPYICIIYVL
jgi:hypothetical protein